MSSLCSSRNLRNLKQILPHRDQNRPQREGKYNDAGKEIWVRILYRTLTYNQHKRKIRQEKPPNLKLINMT